MTPRKHSAGGNHYFCTSFHHSAVVLPSPRQALSGGCTGKSDPACEGCWSSGRRRHLAGQSWANTATLWDEKGGRVSGTSIPGPESTSRSQGGDGPRQEKVAKQTAPLRGGHPRESHLTLEAGPESWAPCLMGKHAPRGPALLDVHDLLVWEGISLTASLRASPPTPVQAAPCPAFPPDPMLCLLLGALPQTLATSFQALLSASCPESLQPAPAEATERHPFHPVQPLPAL